MGELTIFDSSTYPVRIAAQVKHFDLLPYLIDQKDRRRLVRPMGFGVAASMQALGDARLQADTYAPHECGIAAGYCGTRMDLQDFVDMSYEYVSSHGHDFYRFAPGDVLAYGHDMARTLLALRSHFQGPMMTIGTACSASAHAIGEAYRLIQDGDARMMLTGGYDSLTSWMDVLGFGILGALTTDYNDDPTRASRPFDARRSGFVIGEGSVMLVLEERESAFERGAPIYAEILGYGSSMNAYRITDSPPDGSGAIQAMERAMGESGLHPGDIDYVAAHGTGTQGNDASETAALKAVFGDDAYRLAVSSVKSMTGHLTAAAGALNLLVSVLAMRDGVIPPTINLEYPDPKLDLNYVPNTAQHRPVRAALIDAFAFGGTNAAMVVGSASMEWDRPRSLDG